MSDSLKKQVHIYSLDTSAFYNEYEGMIHRKLLKAYKYRKHLNTLKEINKRKNYINKRIKYLKDCLHESFKGKTKARELNGEYLRESNIISIFDSVLTRTLGIQEDELTDEIVVVRTYYFKILKDLIHNGFTYNDERYVYFSSSAGQIRTKKGVWIRESSWEKHKHALTCGLSVKEINKQGGSNINKYLAYIALTNSASHEFEDFDISKTIVVNDLETSVKGLVDYIDRDSYEITRKEMNIPIEHTDGCGMILPQVSKKSFMIRMPFMKGLLSPFPFDEFAKLHNSFVVEDIYGKEWNIIKDDIQIIFTKSQFKMWKYYQSWEHYKKNFIKYGCQAAKLNEEEDIFPEAKLNYQMVQSLTDIADEELEEISRNTIDDIFEIGTDKDTMLRVLGATKGDERKMNHFQKSLAVYPELLNDIHAKQVIKDVKKSLVNDARSARLNIKGKYTFLVPDLYAFCENLFLGIEKPEGLLGDGEVYCDLFEEGLVDVLRSPHLYREHGIRKNVKSKRLSKWFITSGIYTSTFDTISKLLQFDVDGDKALVVDDQTFVEVAKRNMHGIVPLYYEMAVAPKDEVTKEHIYDSLILAFNANIGEISNNISKVWNSDDVDLRVIKWLTMENNFVIDFAKTLFMPKRPSNVDAIINKNIKGRLPHYFKYAKDKKNVEPINSSAVNRLEYIIPNKRIYFSKLTGNFDYKMLMKNPRTKINEEIIDKYTYLIKRKKMLMNSKQTARDDREIYFHTYLRNELLDINNNLDYVVDMLVKHLYVNKYNNSKTELWSAFGDILEQNIKNNIKIAETCYDCKSIFVKLDKKQVRCSVCKDKYDRKRDRIRKKKAKIDS